jgi:8-oxo-dGTP diphosphatase
MAEHVVVAAVLMNEGKILLCHRSPVREWFPGVWDFPGGHIEPGETPLGALTRELDEEIGVQVPQFRSTPLIEKIGDNLDLTVWVCTSWRGTVENRQPQEHDEINWFAREDLPGLTMADPHYTMTLQGLLS